MVNMPREVKMATRRTSIVKDMKEARLYTTEIERTAIINQVTTEVTAKVITMVKKAAQRRHHIQYVQGRELWFIATQLILLCLERVLTTPISVVSPRLTISNLQ